MSTSVGSFLDSRFDDSSRTLALAAGDVLVIALFVAIGEMQHDVTSLASFADTFLTFLIGWGVASPLVGAYSPRATRTVRGAVALTAGSWFLADLIAQALRATAVFEGDAALTFFIVALVFGVLLLSVWRLVAIRLLGLGSDDPR